MASQPDSRESLDIWEQIARLEKTWVELAKTRQDTKLATPAIFFQGMLASAALIGAGAVLAKILP